MKTRVVKKRGKFIPQYKPKDNTIWKEFEDLTSTGLCDPAFRVVSFDTKEEAEQYLIDQFD